MRSGPVGQDGPPGLMRKRKLDQQQPPVSIDLTKPLPMSDPLAPPVVQLPETPPAITAAVGAVMGKPMPKWNGMSADQLKADPSLVDKLRAPAKARYESYAKATTPSATAAPADQEGPSDDKPGDEAEGGANPAAGSPWWKEFKPTLNYDEWKASSKKGPTYYKAAHGDAQDAYNKWLTMKKAKWQDAVDSRKQKLMVVKGTAVPSAVPSDPLAFM